MTLNHARELRKNATDCERLLWQHLRAHRLQGFKFKRQQPLGLYIVDFVCFEARLIIEADGGHHAEQAEYDNRRDDWLRSQGFTVLRFWNNEVLNNIDGVLERILEGCQNSNSPSPQPLPRRGGGAGGEGATAYEFSALPRIQGQRRGMAWRSAGALGIEASKTQPSAIDRKN